MPDAAYANAVERRETLKKELAEIEQFLSLYQKFAPHDDAKTESPKVSETSNNKADSNGATHRRRSLKKMKPKDMAALAKAILSESNRPMTRGQVAKAIEEKGYKIQSEDKPRYVGTVLWRFSKDFENIEGEGYWLRSKPRPGKTESVTE